MSPAPTVALLDIGMLELLLLGLASIMLFGGDLPDVARKAGRLLGRLRATADDFKRQIDVPDEVRDAGRIVRQESRMLGEAARIEDPEVEERRRTWREELHHEEPQGRPPVAQDPIDVASATTDAVTRGTTDEGDDAPAEDTETRGEGAARADDGARHDDTPPDAHPPGAGPHDPLADRAREDPTWHDTSADDDTTDDEGAEDQDVDTRE